MSGERFEFLSEDEASSFVLAIEVVSGGVDLVDRVGSTVEVSGDALAYIDDAFARIGLQPLEGSANGYELSERPPGAPRRSRYRWPTRVVAAALLVVWLGPVLGAVVAAGAAVIVAVAAASRRLRPR